MAVSEKKSSKVKSDETIEQVGGLGSQIDELVTDHLNPSTVYLDLPNDAAAAKACRKLMAMPNSPERVADMLDKLTSIMFKDEENKHTRYEWILLILEKVFSNEPYSSDLKKFTSGDKTDAAQKGGVDESMDGLSIDGVDLSSEDFSDLGIPDFDQLFDKGEDQLSSTEDNLQNLSKLCGDFLNAVELLIDLNNIKQSNSEVMLDLDGEQISFTHLMDEFVNGDLLDKLGKDGLLSMLFALPPGVAERILNRLDDLFSQSLLKRKMYHLSIKRYLGRITYYKRSETDNQFYSSKIEDYQGLARNASEKALALDKAGKTLLEIRFELDYMMSESIESAGESAPPTKAASVAAKQQKGGPSEPALE